MKREAKRQQMRELVELGEREGLSVRELAARSGLSVGTIFRWSRRIRREAAKDMGGPGFVELVGRDSAHIGRIEIVLGGERRLVLIGDVSEDSIARAVRALTRC